MEALEFKKGRAVVLELRERVDEFNTAVLRDELNTILNTGRFFIVIDLGKTSFLSAHCLRAIWACQRRALSFGGDLVLCGATGQVLETVHFVSFDKVVRRFVDLSEACAYIESLPRIEKNSLQPDAPCVEATDTTFSKRFLRWVKRSVASILVGLMLPICASFTGTARALAAEASPNEENTPALQLTRAQAALDAQPQVQSKDAYTLDEVLALAREASPQVKLARLRMIEKDAEVKIAKSFGLPKIMATGGYLYQSNPTIVGEIFNREINNVRNETDELNIEQPRSRTKIQIDKDSMLLGLGFTQIVYSGGVFKNQILLKEAQRNEAESQIAIESLSIEEQVRNLFIGLLLARERINLLNARKEAAVQRMRAIQRARDARTVNALQVAEIEVQGLKADQELLSGVREERSLRGLLNIGLGRPTEADLIPLPTNIQRSFDLQTADQYFEIALHRYPELRRSMSLMDSAAAYLKIVDAQGVFSPQALVFGSVEYTQGLGAMGKDLSWSLGFGVVVPIYDGNKSGAEFEKATSLASQARIAYEESERKLKVEINEVVSHIQQAKLQRELSQKSVEIARTRRQEAESAVKKGQIPQYRLSEVVTGEIEAKIAVIAAEAQLYRWHARLLLLTGQRGNRI